MWRALVFIGLLCVAAFGAVWLADRPGAFPGLKRGSGRIGFQGHTGQVRYRAITIRERPAQ